MRTRPKFVRDCVERWRASKPTGAARFGVALAFLGVLITLTAYGG